MTVKTHSKLNQSQQCNYNNDKTILDGNTTDVPIYQAYNLSKRNFECFIFYWSFIWMSIMGYIVYTRIFDTFTANSYMYVGLIVGLPPIILPILLPQYLENKKLPLLQRYSTKSNLFIFILSFIGNYLWTHYFYSVLGCSYTFPAHRLNNVPFALYLITISYFHTYHLLSNVLLRISYRSTSHKSIYIQHIAAMLIIFILSYFLAFAEAFTIQNFEYYVIPNAYNMYVIGSAFYAIYFIYSFPYYYSIDERINDNQSFNYVFIVSMACCMCVTMTCDFWRLVGPNLTQLNNQNTQAHGSNTLPWLADIAQHTKLS